MRELEMKLAEAGQSIASPIFLCNEEDLPSCTTDDCSVEVNEAMEIMEEVEVQTSHNAHYLALHPQQYLTISQLPPADPQTSFYASNPSHLQGSSIPAMDELDHSEDAHQRPEGRSLDDMTDVDAILEDATKSVPVKKLRSIIPRLMVSCYYKEEDITGKKKVKNLWHTRPTGYPEGLPFKDPNNKDGNKMKPSKEELTKMFDFLKAKYLQMRQMSSQMLPPSVGEPSTMLATSCVKSPLPASPMPVSSQATASHINTTDLQVILKVESPHNQPGSPLYELHTRIQEKLRRVQHMVDNEPHTIAKMEAVNQNVLSSLYHQTSKVDQCCAFLDAGHQFETLLDVVLAFGKDVAMDMLRSGCTELLDKFVPRQAEPDVCQQERQVNGMVYLAEADVKPSLAPADGGPYIPLVQPPDLPSILSPRSQTASEFAGLAISVRSRGSSDRLTQIIEKREPSPVVDVEHEKTEGMDKIDSYIDSLFDEAPVTDYEPPTQQAPSVEHMASIDVAPPSMEETLQDDVLSMEKDYGTSDFMKYGFFSQTSSMATFTAIQPAPATTQLAPPTTEMAPPTTELAPSTTELAPPVTELAPPTTELAPSNAIPIATLSEQQLQSLLKTNNPDDSQKILRAVADQLSPCIPQTVIDYPDGNDVELVSPGQKRQRSARGQPASKRLRPY